MNNKIVDGVELLRKIRDGEFKDKAEIKFDFEIYVYNEEYQDFYKKEQPCYESNGILDNYLIRMLLENKFEILSNEEEEKEIDIQAIEELTREIKRITADANNPHAYGMEIGTYDIIKMGDKINEIIKAIKQLDKKMK